MIREISRVHNGFFRNWTGARGIRLKQLTMIYGPNGSGKSTIASAVLAAKDGDPDAVQLTVDRSEPEQVRAADVSDLERTYVFCSAWVERNHELSHDDASMTTVVTVGEPTIEQAREIARIQTELHALKAKHSELVSLRAKAAQDLDRLYQQISENVVADLTTLGGEFQSRSRFSKRKVREVYEQKRGAFARMVGPDYQQSRQLVLSQPGVTLTIPLVGRIPATDDLAARAQSALAAVPAAAKVLDTLQDRPQAEQWVQQGLELHDGIDYCIYCHGNLTDVRRSEISQHFSDEVTALAAELDSLRDELRMLRAQAENARHAWPSATELAPQLQAQYAQCRNAYLSALGDIETWADEIDKRLLAKRSAVVTHTDLAPVRSVPTVTGDALVAVLGKHNDGVRTHDTRRWEAAIRIRDHHLAKYGEAHEDLLLQLSDADKAEAAAARDVERAQASLAELQDAEGDAGPSAEHLTREVGRLLGRSELRFELQGRERYLVTRNGAVAIGLSEGERKAITLVHFMELVRKHDRATSGAPIVVVDDPVSSLDTDSFAGVSAALWALLQARRPSGPHVGEPWVEQLILLTHSFDLFRQWDIQVDHLHGMRERTTTLELRARHINGVRQPCMSAWPVNECHRRKVRSAYHQGFMAIATEYRALCEEAEAADYGDRVLDAQLLFPNVMRRVLETFMAFKLPNLSSNLNQLMQGSEQLVPETARTAEFQVLRHDLLRYINAASHDSSPEVDQLIPPDEVPRAMRDLFEFMNLVDAKHFEGMCAAVGADPDHLLSR